MGPINRVLFGMACAAFTAAAIDYMVKNQEERKKFVRKEEFDDDPHAKFLAKQIEEDQE